MKFIKHIIFCLIIFSNTCFGKEFNELFIVYEPIQDNSNIEKSINNSFNTMIYRLSGDPSPSNIWKIINADNSRKDFIRSYSIKNYNNESFLQVDFDKDLLVKKFNELSISAIGISRPVILFLINIDSGSSNPYLLKDSESKSEIDFLIKKSLKKLHDKRGIFLELPEPDLNDLDLISSYSKLINSNNLLNSKFASDQVVEINITKVGVDDWLVNGDMSFEYKDKNFNNFFIERFEKYVTSKINNLLNSNTIDTSQLDFAKLSIANIFSFDDYSNSRDLIKNLVGTKEISIDSFEIDQLPLLDQWMLGRLVEVTDQISNAYENYEFSKFFQILQSFCVVDLSNFYLDIAKDRLYVSSKSQFRRRSCQFVMSKVVENLAVLISPVLCHMAEDIWQNIPYSTEEKSVFQRGWPIFSQSWKNQILNEHIANLRNLRVEINKAIEGCRNKQIIGAALETEVNYLPEDKVLKDSLTWLKEFGNQDVDLFRDWLIVSNFQVVSDLVENSLIIDNNALGKIQIRKAHGQKCDRCWHYQKETFNGIQNTKLCKRCSNIINSEFF